MPDILVMYKSAVAPALPCLAAISVVGVTLIAAVSLPQFEVRKNRLKL
jgi:hypothetical protein